MIYSKLMGWALGFLGNNIPYKKIIIYGSFIAIISGLVIDRQIRVSNLEACNSDLEKSQLVVSQLKDEADELRLRATEIVRNLKERQRIISRLQTDNKKLQEKYEILEESISKDFDKIFQSSIPLKEKEKIINEAMSKSYNNLECVTKGGEQCDQ